MRKQLLAISISAALLLAACSGGGGGGGSTNPDQVFDLGILHDLNPGLVYSTQISGSVTPGGAVTGSISITNSDPFMKNSIFVTRTDTVVSMAVDGVSTSSTGSSYRDQDGFLIERQNGGVTCTPVTPSKMPTSVKLGDSGVLPELICNDNTTWTTSWKAESAGPDKINLVGLSTNKSLGNEVLLTGTDTYTIGASGNVLKYSSTGSGHGVSYSIASP